MYKSGKKAISTDQRNQLIKLHKQGKVTMEQIKETKARPLGISSFPDKVVQEAMKITLNAIYDPEFARINVNLGFRPTLGCHSAIIQIQQYSKQMDWAIEGDIKGAFDNVNHEILLNILSKKIKDKYFLKLVKSGLKCGLIYLNYRQDSDIGTTQGSVLSPLLYNVYFHEFDKYICTEFKDIVDQLNTKEKRTERPINKLYNSLSKQKTMIKLQEKLAKWKSYTLEHGPIGPMQNSLFKEFQYAQKIYNTFDKQQKMIPAFAKSRQTIRFTYTRYADDWIFLTNATKERVLEWKELFKNQIAESLELTLSPEKTKVTNLKNGEIAKFLGFQLKRQTKQRITKVGNFTFKSNDIARRSKVTKTAILNNDKIIFKIRATNPSLIVAWDRDRVLTNLMANGFIKKVGNSWRGRSKLPWTILSEPEIVERFNYVIRGYLDYYVPVTDYPTDVHFLHYLLIYSCIHTLAQKGNTSVRSIFKKYGKNINIKYIEKVETTNEDGSKQINQKQKNRQLYNWDDFLGIIYTIGMTS